jgi:tetratricopeptide (TPR) repeat protein
MELERAGRIDSADTQRIEVLKFVDPVVLGEEGLFVVTLTADKFDFPEARDLLQSFLDRHPTSESYPEALFRLAMRQRKAGLHREAAFLLNEIIDHWPDDPTYAMACLRMASWLIEEGDAEPAIRILGNLLANSQLAPLQAAKALLLRAQGDFHTGETNRARLGCRRILALYPAFQEVTEAAASLLESLPLEDPSADA